MKIRFHRKNGKAVVTIYEKNGGYAFTIPYEEYLNSWIEDE